MNFARSQDVVMVLYKTWAKFTYPFNPAAGNESWKRVLETGHVPKIATRCANSGHVIGHDVS